MDYDLYHDESKENGYWHGMLLIPKSTRRYLLHLLDQPRKHLAFDGVQSFKAANPKNKHRFQCGRSWIQIGAGALMQEKKSEPYPGYASGRNIFDRESLRATAEYRTFECLVRAKFILFRERDSHLTMSDFIFPDHSSKIETTLRMGLKGGLHLLGSDDKPMNVLSIHLDGHQHLGRNVNKARIVDRILGLRSYCTFIDDLIIDDRSSNHILPEAKRQDYDDCQLLQLTDLMIGAFRAVLSARKDSRIQLAKPVLKLVQDWKKGRARMSNSRWFQGYCLSECWLEERSWKFGEIEVLRRDLGQCEMF